MRELIIKRLEEIREMGFSTDQWRWRNFKYFKDIKFNDLNDNDLFILFENILRQYNKPM